MLEKKKKVTPLSILRGFLGLEITFLIIALVLLLFLYYPQIYDSIYGAETVNQFIEEELGNKSAHNEIAPLLLDWMSNNIHYPQDDERIFGNLYKLNNKTFFLYRGTPASWIIKTKVGKCGEFAIFFTRMMVKLGYKAKYIQVEGWDHSWAEYYTPEGIKIIVDTSGNKIITDPVEWVQGKNITTIYALDLDGNKENVTLDYMLG